VPGEHDAGSRLTQCSLVGGRYCTTAGSDAATGRTTYLRRRFVYACVCRDRESDHHRAVPVLREGARAGVPV